MFWATMPKAAINEQGYTVTAKNKVWFTWKRLMAPPAGDSGRAKNGCQLQLSVLVAEGADRGHHLGSLRPIEYVWHEGIMTNGTLVCHWKTCELRASELWGESSWWWRHWHQCCEGDRGAMPVILLRSDDGASAGHAMTTRPGTCWGGLSRRSLGVGGSVRVLAFRRRARC